MQRRAAAMYVAFFLIIAVGSIGFINLVEAPSPAMDEYDHQVAPDDSFDVDDTTYTLTGIDVFSATLEWSVEESEQTELLRNESTIESEETEYRIEIPPGDEPDSFFLQELYPDHGLETVEVDGRTYVVITENDEDEFVPEDEYLREEYGAVERLELTVDDTFYYDAVNETVTVEAIDTASVEVGWVGPEDRSITLSPGESVELEDTTFVANFVGTEYIQLTSDQAAYDEHAAAMDTWDERYLGFWAIGVLSIFSAILIGALSYLPRRR